MTSAISVQRVINAPADKIFELLATPSHHALFDGSGTVKDHRSDPSIGTGQRVQLGDEFSMAMHFNFSYSTRNVVVEYVENELIAWQTWAPAPADKFITGRIWRYELTPVDNGTLVRETWDPATERPVTKPLLGLMANLTRKNMSATLDRLNEVLTGQ